MTCYALESITIHSQEVSAFTTQWMWMSHIILSQTKFLFSLHRLTASCDSFSELPTHLPTHSHKTSQRIGRESPVRYPHQGSLVPFCSGLESSKVTWVNIAMVIALGGHWETAEADSWWSTLSPGVPRVVISACSNYYGFWLKNGQAFLSLAPCSNFPLDTHTSRFLKSQSRKRLDSPLPCVNLKQKQRVFTRVRNSFQERGYFITLTNGNRIVILSLLRFFGCHFLGQITGSVSPSMNVWVKAKQENRITLVISHRRRQQWRLLPLLLKRQRN